MAQQIADYFSRLTAKRNIDENTQEEDDEEEAAIWKMKPTCN